MIERSYLVVRFDITDLSDEEWMGLAGEVEVQAEASERHPDVPVVSSETEGVWVDLSPPVDIKVGGIYIVHGQRVQVTEITAAVHPKPSNERVRKIVFKKLDQSTPVSTIYGVSYGGEEDFWPYEDDAIEEA